RFIETVHQRGYRFLPAVTAQPVVSIQYSVGSRQEAKQKAKIEFCPLTPYTQHPAPTLVKRDAELAQLHSWLDKAIRGERQVVFVTGEPGIGKTTVVEAFLQRLAFPEQEENQQKKRAAQSPTPSPQHPAPVPWLGRGQCIEQYRAGKAYMPI